MVMTRKPEIVNTVRLNNIQIESKLVYFAFDNDVLLDDSIYPGHEINDVMFLYGINCLDAISQDSLILRKYNLYSYMYIQ